MNRAGITKARIRPRDGDDGPHQGRARHVNVLASVFLSGISGSAVADAAALAKPWCHAMRARAATPTLYASALTAAASMIGPIIPPSIIMVFQRCHHADLGPAMSSAA